MDQAVVRDRPKRPRWPRIVLGVVVALSIFAICDWTRPPQKQISVALYEKIVIGGYRTLVQPMSNRFIHCRFRPTCSVYSEEAMRRFGFPKGIWLTTTRLCRCMPWVTAETADPIPDVD